MISNLPASPFSIEWNAGERSWLGVRLLLLATAGLAIACLAFLPLTYAVAILGGIAVTVLVLRYPTMGLLLIVISVPWGSGIEIHAGGAAVTPTDGLVALVGAAWLAVAARDRANPFPRTVWTRYVFLFLAAIALSITQASDPKASAPEILKWLEMAVVYCAAAQFIRDRSTLRWIVFALVAAGVSQAVLGYGQFLLQLGPAAFGAHRPFFRSYGTFDQPNPYAGFLNMTLPMAISLSLLGVRTWERRLAAISALVIATALLASQSRGGLLAGLVASAVVLGLSTRFAREALKFALVVVPLAALATAYSLLPSSQVDRVLSAVGLGNVSFGDVTNANFSAVERAAHWLAGVRMFASHPVLGVGIGNYPDAYPRYHPRGWYASLGHAHNYYINIAAEAGVVGLLAYTLLIGTALWYAFAAVRRISGRFYTAVLLGVLGALSATAFHNLFDVLYVHGMAALTGLLVALVPVSLKLDAGE
jgi:O-antigen ligase